MSTNNLYAGHDQADVASLTTSRGVFYRCYVWLNRSIPVSPGVSVTGIEAVCYTEQEHGQPVEVFRSFVAVAADETEAVDSPKIVAVGSTFVVHWIGRTGTNESMLATFALHRATQDMETFSASSWTYRGDVVLHPHALYDVCSVGDAGFIVARYSAFETIAVIRFDGFDWVDIDWSTVIEEEPRPTILGVYADETDDDVIVSIEIAGTAQLWSFHLAAGDGSGLTAARTFAGFPTARWVQVTHARTGSGEIAVLAEAIPIAQLEGGAPNEAFIHWVVYGRISSADCTALGNHHWCPGVTLASRAWSYSSGTTASGGPPDVYAMLAFKSVEDPYNWAQSYAWACNFDRARWGTGANDASVRPRPIATANSVGVPDGRIAGLTPSTGNELYSSYPRRRMNHLGHASPAPQFGPHVKSRTVAAIAFARLETQRSEQAGLGDPLQLAELVPAGAGVVGYRVYMEDPWISPRDASEPARPVPNFSQAYPLAMHQSVEAGRALIVAGGCPSSYDGTQLVEVGYPWRPELISVDVDSGADEDETLLIGWYQVYAVYKWTDNQGQVHRSGPSTIRTFYADQNFPVATYRIRTQSLSLRGPSEHHPNGQPIEIEVYRTPVFALDTMIADGDVVPGSLPQGGLFYRVFGSGDPLSAYRPVDTPVNDPSDIAVTVVDGLSATNLVAHGLGPYQVSESGIVPTPPQQPPAMSVITRWRNRVWLATGEDEATIWYSREIGLDYGADFYRAVEFNDGNTFRLDGLDEVTGMVGMNTGLAVFTRASIGWITGDNLDGTLAMQLQLEVLHTGTGCIEPRSIAFGPPGVFFQSGKGYFLLNRDRGLDYVSAGAAVEELLREAGNVRSATILEDRNQLRLVCNGIDEITQRSSATIPAPTGGVATITISGYAIQVTLDGFEIAATVAQMFIEAIEAEAEPGEALEDIVAGASRSGAVLTIQMADGVYDIDVSIVMPNAATPTITTVNARVPRPQVLLYDYLHGLWASIPMVGVSTTQVQNLAVGGCAWRGVDGDVAHVVLHQGGVHVERGSRDEAPYTDSTSVGDVGIPIDILTSWIQLAGIAGYHRVRRMVVQGTRHNSAAWYADVEFDDDGTFDGDDPPPDIGIEFDPDEASGEIRPSVQKLGAFRVRIYEDTGVLNDRTISLTALVVEAGIKKGTRRGADAQIGT